MKKINILILLLIIGLLSVLCITGFFNNDISLTQQSTNGIHDIYDDTGKEFTYYYINGVLKGLPDNVEGYALKLAIYDENGKFITEEKFDYSLEFVVDSSKLSEPDIIECLSIEGFKNVSIMELTIYNPDGMKIFNENVTFTMKNVTEHHYNQSDADDNDYDEEYDNEDIDNYDNNDNSNANSNSNSHRERQVRVIGGKIYYTYDTEYHEPTPEERKILSDYYYDLYLSDNG